MASTNVADGQAINWMRYSGRALALFWVLLWGYLAVASGLGDSPDPSGLLVYFVLPGLFLVSVLIAWWWEIIGGPLLVIEGLFVLIVYPALPFGGSSPFAIAFVLVTMGLPPLIAGGLFVLSWLRHGRSGVMSSGASSAG